MVSRNATAPVLTGAANDGAVDCSAAAGRAGQEPDPLNPGCARLAAVVHLDMVGYSRLMGLDQAGTLGRLQDVFATLLRPLAARDGGRIANTAGDSALLVFPGTGAAVHFALAFQQSIKSREAGELLDRALRFRIGITVADVLEAGGTDVHGDGVNIAARLQAACPPGAVCVSRGVREQAQGKGDAAFEPMGALLLKNIARPVEAYVVHPRGTDSEYGSRPDFFARLRCRLRRRAWAALAAVALIGGGAEGWRAVRLATVVGAGQTSAASALPDLSVKHAPRLSLAVLPFANTSGDAGQDYLADAVTDDLTTDLSRLDGSFVIGRGSAQAYRGRAVDARRVGGELGVRYLVQGSVRRLGEGVVRVNAGLVSTETGEEFWSERFDQDVRDLGQGQGDIVQRLGSVLKTRLVDTEAARSLHEHPDDPDAFDLVLRARSLVSRSVNRSRAGEAEALYRRALDLDPKSVSAMVGLASRLLSNIALLNEGKPGDIKRASQLLAAAEALRPDSLSVIGLRASVRLRQGRYDEAIAAYQQVIDGDPNVYGTYGAIGVCRLHLGQPEQALPLFREAIRRNPADSYVWVRYGLLGRALLQLHQPEDAIPWLRRAIDGNPARDEPSSQLNRLDFISALAHAGRRDEARKQAAEAGRLGIIPFLTVRSYEVRSGRLSPEVARLLYVAEGLRLAGLRDHVDEDADAGVLSTGDLHQEPLGPTPTSAPGALVIRTDALQRLLAEDHPLVLDGNATGRSLLGAVILGDNFTGGSLDDDKQERLRRKMRDLMGDDLARPIVTIGWNAERWGSRNLALRLVALGYKRVLWYRGGKEVWEASGLPEADADKAEW